MSDTSDGNWARWAAHGIRAAHGEVETPLVCFELPARMAGRLVFKNESVHPSGSLKHRLAASLIIFGVCNGDIGPGTTLVDASSGSTAVSEAYFAREIGLPFVAVVARSTSPSKLTLITEMGGSIEFVDDPRRAAAVATELGTRPDYVFLDQFSHASSRTNWRQNNLASALFSQLREGGYGEPDWVVLGAGTGGTSSTVARYACYEDLRSRIAIADPEGSAYYLCWIHKDRLQVGRASRIEGIGRPQVEPSFIAQLIDEVIPVPDRWSVAGMRVLQRRGISAGISTGTNLVACLQLLERQQGAEQPPFVASLICDGAERYEDTYNDDVWLAEQNLGLTTELEELEAFLSGGPTPTSWSLAQR